MDTLNLPEPIAAYLTAEHDPEAQTHCLTARAVAPLEAAA